MNLRLTALLTLILPTVIPAAAQNGRPDAEGFIRDWLVLAPVPTNGTPGADALDEKQFADEAMPKATEGAKQKVGAKELTWKKITTAEYYIDFKEMNPAEGDFVIGWAVAYIVSPDAKTGVTLRMNSNDQGKAFLNGKEVVKYAEPRTMDKDVEDKAENLTLNAGVNVVVLKVINDENNWQGAIRFFDKAGKPLTDIKVQTKP